MRDEFLIFGSPALGEAEIGEVVHSLHSGWLGTGPKVARWSLATVVWLQWFIEVSRIL